jgi:hypothetical protein
MMHLEVRQTVRATERRKIFATAASIPRLSKYPSHYSRASVEVRVHPCDALRTRITWRYLEFRRGHKPRDRDLEVAASITDTRSQRPQNPTKRLCLDGTTLGVAVSVPHRSERLDDSLRDGVLVARRENSNATGDVAKKTLVFLRARSEWITGNSEKIANRINHRLLIEVGIIEHDGFLHRSEKPG